jgi:beta-phosphoglucomutase-like phosphatase (HAD superfamily)
VAAAIAAGMRVLAFAGGSHCAPGYEAMLRAAGARQVFADMAQLPGLLEEAAVE